MLAVGLNSCCPKYYPQVVYRDSVRVEIRERIVHDTVKFEVPVIKEKNVTRDTSSHLENDWAKSDASVSDGLLYHSLETKPKTVYVPVEVPVHDTLYIEKEGKETVVPKEVEKPLTWWQRFRLKGFWWLLGSLSILLLWALRKQVLRII